MAFPPHFLDELRGRVGLAALIGRHVKLTRKGREQSGLCPFHNEKTPSFTVNEEKGFFHCFGCGAHGDQFGYVMRTENLSFPEAVERLADEAGLAVPESSPEERETAKRQATLYQVMERACAFFEGRLHGEQGRGALDYLRGRGLDDDAMARFRLGYAPDSRGALKDALLNKRRQTSPSSPPRGGEGRGEVGDSGASDQKPRGGQATSPSPSRRDGSPPSPPGGGEGEITEAQLIEAGLLIKPEDGGASYDRFRGRVTFPIADRRGRVIAFGARALSSEAQAKYLNSPDTPLFHKGQVLYGMATAWPAARQKGRIAVVEGYMDVIALVRAGIEEAVAPLGTALTESQIQLLWRMAPEPVLCFDGDAAGQRAAFRAAERALPMLQPGFSLRFVALPAGEDPDTLIATQGADAMEALLEAARPLDQVIWDMESAAGPADTPERIAGLEHRLEQRAYAIADGKVQYQYLGAFRRRLREMARPAALAKGGRFSRGGGYGSRDYGQRDRRGSSYGSGGSYGSRGNYAAPAAAPLVAPEGGVHRREQAVLATLVNHWGLLDEVAETIGTLEFADPALDKLRQEILLLYAASPDLDSEAVGRHLMETGCSEGLEAILTPEVYVSARSARADSDAELARKGLLELVHGMRLEEAKKLYAAQPTEENFARLQECQGNTYQSLRESV